jgi:hypothetical protein
MLLDIHGHSRNMNVFIYGCSRTHSWLAEDQQRAAADPDAEPCAAQVTTQLCPSTNKPAVWQICILQPLLIKKDTTLSTRFFSIKKLINEELQLLCHFGLKFIVIFFV